MITLSIDVTQLDKTRFKRITRKNGKEAIFADLILIDTPESDYGDYIVKQQVTKEERAAKLEMPILGNAKQLIPVAQAAKEIKTHVEKTHDDEGDEIPF